MEKNGTLRGWEGVKAQQQTQWIQMVGRSIWSLQHYCTVMMLNLQLQSHKRKLKARDSVDDYHDISKMKSDKYMVTKPTFLFIYPDDNHRLCLAHPNEFVHGADTSPGEL